MANWKTFAIANVLLIGMTGAPQLESFEKQAFASVQAMPASDLDPGLSSQSFGNWFEQVIGVNAGIVWQLTECGEQPGVSGETGNDLIACTEVNVILPDKRRVFVAIRVGTFKKGLTGKPAFIGAVIEQDAKLHQVRRLRDLPEMLRAKNISEVAPPSKTIIRMPDRPVLNEGQLKLITPSQSLPPLSSNNPGAEVSEETPPRPPSNPQPSPLEPVNVSESALQSRAITKVKPAYPPNARKMNATGAVEVEITVSETGQVVEAKAVAGHIALRGSAVDAARKWVFKPATFDGAPVKVRSVLTFYFTPSSK